MISEQKTTRSSLANHSSSTSDQNGQEIFPSSDKASKQRLVNVHITLDEHCVQLGLSRLLLTSIWFPWDKEEFPMISKPEATCSFLYNHVLRSVARMVDRFVA